MNSTKHGYWARPLKPLDRGPLQEDPDEMAQFIGAVLEELKPGDSVLLRQSALDVAHMMWRQTRAQRWEAYGYSSTNAESNVLSQADWLERLAAMDRRGAHEVRVMGESSSSADELWHALAPLSFHLGISEEDLDKVADENVAGALETLVTEEFDSPEDAARILESRAEERESEARLLREATLPSVIREELDGSFSKNSERMVAHASRELDRSLKRYWQLWERVQMAQPPGEGQIELSGVEASGSLSERVTSTDAVGHPLELGVDWHELEALLDKHDVDAFLEKLRGSTQGE